MRVTWTGSKKTLSSAISLDRPVGNSEDSQFGDLLPEDYNPTGRPLTHAFMLRCTDDFQL